jgi:hypothetical protein
MRRRDYIEVDGSKPCAAAGYFPKYQADVGTRSARDRARLRCVVAQISDAYAAYYSSMVDIAASVYATNFTVEELREIDAFYRLPVGQKFLQKSQAITEQGLQIGQDASRKAADDLRMRLTELLRQKGHKM